MNISGVKTLNLFCHVHPFSRASILPVYKLQANGVFFLTMLLCQIFSSVFSQWHMYGIGVVLLVALNDLVGSDAPVILRNFLQRFKSTKEEQTHILRLCCKPLYLQVNTCNRFSTELHQHSICLNVFEHLYFYINVQYDLPISFQYTCTYFGIGKIKLRDLDIM